MWHVTTFYRELTLRSSSEKTISLDHVSQPGRLTGPTELNWENDKGHLSVEASGEDTGEVSYYITHSVYFWWMYGCIFRSEQYSFITPNKTKICELLMMPIKMLQSIWWVQQQMDMAKLIGAFLQLLVASNYWLLKWIFWDERVHLGRTKLRT
jgi:hypothetical protein